MNCTSNNKCLNSAGLLFPFLILVNPYDHYRILPFYASNLLMFTSINSSKDLNTVVKAFLKDYNGVAEFITCGFP